MQTDLSVHERKVSLPDGGDMEDLITFGDARAAIAAFLRDRGGKTLLISDGSAFSVIQDAVCSPRVMSIVAEEDCLPLFSMPEVTAVIGVGGAETMISSRFFAGLRHIPCLLVPTVATLEGACGSHGRLTVNGVARMSELCGARVIADKVLLAATRSRAVARLFLAQLEIVEGEARTIFSLKDPCLTALPAAGEDDEGLLRANAALCLHGEGDVLRCILQAGGERQPEWSAFFHLTALYSAFFSKGKPRRYLVPDYRRRAAEAGKGAPRVPAPAEFALRAFALERARTPVMQRLAPLLAAREELVRQFGAPRPALRALKYLPEYCPGGLSCVTRDFGLMEWS